MGFGKLIGRVAPSFVSRVLTQLAENVLAVVLMVIMFGGGWYVLTHAVPAHDKRIYEGQKQIAEKFIEAGQSQSEQFIRATTQLQDKHAVEQRHIIESFVKERERDRERDKEREAMMREIKDWLRQSKVGRTGIELGTIGRN